MRNTIYISDNQNKISVDKELKNLIRKVINATLKEEAFDRPAEVSVTLVDDEEISEINSEARGMDKPTDVLSFPMFDEDFGDEEKAVLGDIVISLERAKAQAIEYGHSFEREVAFLCVHSVLHLLGYDHETSKEDEVEMFKRQDEILEKLNILR